MKLLTKMSLVGCFFLGANVVIADEFTQATVDEAHAEFMSAVEKGRGLFVDPNLGSNGVVCTQCHPDGANTHPETYPKFQKQLGKVAPMWEMVNC
jgi:hypothetical protein